MAITNNPFRLPLKSRFLANAIERLLGLHKLAVLYDQRPRGLNTKEFLVHALDRLRIRLKIVDEDKRLEWVPTSGPLLIVANHPLGGLEGVAITKLMLAIRPDTKVLTNELLTQFEELEPVFIGVNVISENASRENMLGVREAMRHICDGGSLLIFPAGKVATINLRNRRIEDQPWNHLVGKILQRSGATCLPIHVGGYNSKLFYLLALIHTRLRTALLPRQLINKQGSELQLTIGELITQQELGHLDNAHAITDYLRLSTEFLNLKSQDNEVAPSTLNFEDIPPPSGKVQQHLDTLKEFLLISKDVFDVYCVPYEKLDLLMHEIGIAREFTFRAVGEGTGNAVDSDRFDPHCLHLFVWDREQSRIAGGYRIGHTHEIADKYGIDALYNHTLFKFDRDYLEKVGPSLEMGRSFVYPDYQRHPMVLDLLWRGIGGYVARNPQYHTLFGAVSISREYSHFARALIAESMVTSFPPKPHLMEKIYPIVPLKVAGKPWSKKMLASFENVSTINKLVGRCDPGKALPPLLRHYLSLNCKFVCFSVNKVFNDSLDGLILVDLRKMPKRYLKRYFGKEGARTFEEKWNLAP